jgi:hypothetical protein
MYSLHHISPLCKSTIDFFAIWFVRHPNTKQDRVAVRTVFFTAIPLGIAWLLTYGEWEMMTLFAA